MVVIHAVLVFTIAVVYVGLSDGDHNMELPTSDRDGVNEYCLNEDFRATCLKNEVVLVNKATFGRMKIGRCLQNEDEEMLAQTKNNPKFFGCSVDVKHIIDEKCFGKDHCTVRVFNDIDQKVTKTCYESLKSYLEASYACASVIEPDRLCTVSVTSSAQHLMISHSSSTKLSCGIRHQPWKLEAPAGQQINVSLLDFEETENQREKECLPYGYIIDTAAKKNVSICAAHSNSRNNIIYTSQTNEVSITFGEEYFSNSQMPLQKVLLRFEAIGCTDVIPPEDMWLRRRNQEAVVGCYSSRQTWYLSCVNNQWLGVIGNCTRDHREEIVVDVPDNVSSARNQVLIMVSISVIGVIICLTIIICGVVCMKRYTSMMKMEIPARHVEKLHNGSWQADCGNATFLHQNRQLI